MPHRHSRSIDDIIDAVERSKSHWPAVAPFAGVNSTYASSSFTPDPVPSPADEGRADAERFITATLIPLPQPPPPSASRQEHHRYFYALRKATRIRKQQQQSVQVTSQPRPNPAPAVVETDEEPRAVSRSSSSSASPTACRPSSTISTCSTSTTTIDSRSVPNSKTTYAAILSAWQRTPTKDAEKISAIPSPALIVGEYQSLGELLLDDDQRETERLFEELSASLYFQHAELAEAAMFE